MLLNYSLRDVVLAIFFLALLSIVTITSNCFADDIKDRMKNRLPTIVKMKQQGIVGENSKGYLEYVSANRVNQDIIDSENRDRQQVYTNIAKEQGVPIEKVEQLRAAQIVQKAASGEFLKKEDGSWYQK